MATPADGAGSGPQSVGSILSARGQVRRGRRARWMRLALPGRPDGAEENGGTILHSILLQDMWQREDLNHECIPGPALVRAKMRAPMVAGLFISMGVRTREWA